MYKTGALALHRRRSIDTGVHKVVAPTTAGYGTEKHCREAIFSNCGTVHFELRWRFKVFHSSM